MDEMLETIKMNVLQGRVDAEDEGLEGDMEGKPGVLELVKEAVEKGLSPKNILLDGLTAGMEEVGRKYEAGEYLIPDMLAAAEAVGGGMDILEPHLKGDETTSKGRFLIATVEGDLHDIGKNIVATMLRGSGFEVKDLGAGVASDKIIGEAKEFNPKFVGLSALLTTTMPHMKETIDKLKEIGMRDKVKVLIGGAPTSEEFAASIGADHHCRDAFDALDKLKTA